MPKTVVFDLGNVLISVDYARAARRLERLSNCSIAALQPMIDQSPLLHRFERGELSSRDFFEEFRGMAGFRGEFDLFREIFGDIFFPLPPMIDLVGELQARGTPLVLFSNTNAIAAERVRKDYPFYQCFDHHVLSFEEGVMKPDAPLYEVVEARAGAKGDQLIYIDDRPENIAAGAARGWRTILHTDPGVTLKSLVSNLA